MSDCSFTRHLLNIHQSGHNAVWLLYGWCHIKLLLSQHKFCVHHSTMHQFIVSLYLKPQRMHVCLALTRPPACLAEWLQSFMCYCSNMGGWNRDRNKIQHNMLTLEKKIIWLGHEPETFQSQVRCSATEPSALPWDRQPTLFCQQSVPKIGKHRHMYTFIKSHAIYSMLQLKICSNNYYLFSCEITKWRNKRICFPICFSCCSWLQALFFMLFMTAGFVFHAVHDCRSLSQNLFWPTARKDQNKNSLQIIWF